MMLSPVQICMDSTDWPQSMMQERVGFRTSATVTEDLLSCSRPLHERALKPQPEQALKCPRCDSTNTKFCYYNNYSLSQPRHFCKTCRRYWTKGGALRTVPVGGGCRKNKKAKRTAGTDHSATLNEPSTSSANITALPNVNPATNSANTNIFFNNSTTISGLSDVNAAAAFSRVQQQAALANCNAPDFLGLSCGPSNPQSSFGLSLNPINLSTINALHALKSTFPSLANDFPVVNSNKSTTDPGSSSSSLIPPSEWQLPSESNLFAADSTNFWSPGVWPDLTSYIGSSSSM